MWGNRSYDPFTGIYADGFPQPNSPPGSFTRRFRSYPVSFIDKSHLENGDKIILPPSALDALARHNITYPMMFQLESSHGRKTHCGVLEFVALEGHAYIPYWLMQNLSMAEGDMITIRNANLPPGTFVKFQPQSSEFLKISNPKAVLEATLRGFTCLTKGDSISINYNDKTYCLDVLEVAPGDAISIIEADVNVEFEAPVDYQELQPPSRKPVPKPVNLASGDASDRLKSRLEELKKRPVGADSDSSEDDKPPPKPMFPGMGQTLKRSGGPAGLTFGGSTSKGGISSRKIDNDEEKKEAEKKPFVVFEGAGRSLR